MIQIQHKIPRTVGVAVSGGVDSMAVLDFLRRRHSVTVFHFNHGTVHGSAAEKFLVDYCRTHDLKCVIGKIENAKPQHKSWEEHWRDERYRFFTVQDTEIVLGHHLDDCVETYVFNMCHGKGYTIPYRHHNCIRPFRLNRKQELMDWALRNNVPWIDDNSNQDTNYARNHIRNVILPQMLKVNPGIYKVIYKRLKAES